MPLAALVERKTSTSEYREYRSITTSKYSLEGSGPQKSICIVSHGPFGIGIILTGSGGHGLPTA